MQISRQTFTQMQKQSLHVQGEVELPELSREVNSLVRVEPVQVEGVIERVGDEEFVATINQETTATFVCSRCLEPFTKPVKTSWTERLTLSPSSDEQEELLPIGDHFVLDERVREAFLLQIPFAPICRESCQGLCPECGVNRNHQSCDCKTEYIDPRLAKLKEFGQSNG